MRCLRLHSGATVTGPHLLGESERAEAVEYFRTLGTGPGGDAALQVARELGTPHIYRA